MSNPFPMNFLDFWNTFGTAAVSQSKTVRAPGGPSGRQTSVTPFRLRPRTTPRPTQTPLQHLCLYADSVHNNAVCVRQQGIDALFPKTRQATLAATFGEPRRWWYMRELARHLRLTPSSLQRELASLVRAGILVQKRDGKHVYFQAATESPIFQELQGLILKTAGLADVIRDALKPLANRIQWAFVYGSVARSQEHSASDVDLMIIGHVGLAD